MTVETGSSLYYSVLYCEPALREQIVNLRHIYQKISKINSTTYNWWQNELQQKYPELLPALNAFLQDSQTSLYEDEASLNHFYQQTAGLFERAIGKLAGMEDDPKLEALGIYIAKINHLNQLRTYIEQGKIYFSGETLINHQTNLYEFSQLKITPNLHKLLLSETERIQKYYRINCFKPSQILANIHKALLEEIINADFPVFTHQIGLTPLRKWWIAWRTR